MRYPLPPWDILYPHEISFTPMRYPLPSWDILYPHEISFTPMRYPLPPWDILYPHEISFTPMRYPGTHFCKRLSRLHVHSSPGRIKSMKDPNDPIMNRTRDLPPFSAVPRPTAPPRTQFPLTHLVVIYFIFCKQGTLYSGETLTLQQSAISTTVTWRVFGWFALRTTVDRYWKRSVCLLLCVICLL